MISSDHSAKPAVEKLVYVIVMFPMNMRSLDIYDPFQVLLSQQAIIQEIKFIMGKTLSSITTS